MYADLTSLCVGYGATLHDAARCMDKNRLGVVLIIDANRRLLGTLTDGDLRRAVLARMAMDESVSTLLARKAGSPYAKPITASIGAGPAEYLRILQDNSIRHLPLLDANDCVAGLVTIDDFVPRGIQRVRAVIMAGGAGSRLRPLTEETPKPMLPVGDQPLIEIIVGQLRDAGIRRVNITTHHRPDKISDHFGDGREFGVEVSYVTEDRPLGTAGALGLLEIPRETTLVMNGDILTQVDLRAMIDFHRAQGADLTIAVRQFDVPVPYGVVECDGAEVKRLTEKPVLDLLVNAGIYLMEPSVYAYIPSHEAFDMTDLIQRLLEAGRPLASFPIREYWLDIGQIEDYARAQQDVKRWKKS